METGENAEGRDGGENDEETMEEEDGRAPLLDGVREEGEAEDEVAVEDGGEPRRLIAGQALKETRIIPVFSRVRL